MAGSSMGSGLWQSDDTGKTWKQLGWKHIKAYSMDHDSNGRILYLAAGNGVLKSTDHGESWRVMTDWRVSEVMDVKTIPKHPQTVIAATAHGIFRSTDAGESWKRSHKGIEQPYVSQIYVEQHAIYACAESGFYCSTNQGVSWKLVKRSPRPIRAAEAFKDLTMIVGDSHWALYRFDNSLASAHRSSSALWAAHYPSRLNQRFVGGIKGVGEFIGHEDIAYRGPKNVHALSSIGDVVFAGTLGEGLWAREQAGEWRQMALPRSNVWSLHTTLIE
ncbi:MAG TPA: hypothetical protein VFH43_01990 [Candidatus Kapabacteria bacterium]|nr:hypothetical protein [Candidatus Kapabacteria bacterium]